MVQSFRVFLNDQQEIGVSDDYAGWNRLVEIHREYGDCKVWVYDRNDVFGVGYKKATPMLKTKLSRLES